ncbi:hypothetical protein PROPEN_00103 [Proteus penneri ATCC 35198]|nr:hypothetical protein PROPEN_00103 [Proteus penneri ATCC 35198]
MSSLCPCNSQLFYSDCCEPYHLGQKNAPTAEALMRSRYSAFVKHNDDYLIKKRGTPLVVLHPYMMN